MIKFDIDENNMLVEIHLDGPLQEKDFTSLSAAVDPLIEKKGMLSGILIQAKNFPGWESFAAMIQHFKFIKNHHKKIKKIALVTDTKLAKMAETIMPYFLATEIKKFPADEKQLAKDWIIGK